MTFANLALETACRPPPDPSRAAAPAGLILLARWLIPTEVMREAQERAEVGGAGLQRSGGTCLCSA